MIHATVILYRSRGKFYLVVPRAVVVVDLCRGVEEPRAPSPHHPPCVSSHCRPVPRQPRPRQHSHTSLLFPATGHQCFVQERHAGPSSPGRKRCCSRRRPPSLRTRRRRASSRQRQPHPASTAARGGWLVLSGGCGVDDHDRESVGESRGGEGGRSRPHERLPARSPGQSCRRRRHRRRCGATRRRRRRRRRQQR